MIISALRRGPLHWKGVQNQETVGKNGLGVWSRNVGGCSGCENGIDTQVGAVKVTKALRAEPYRLGQGVLSHNRKKNWGVPTLERGEGCNVGFKWGNNVEGDLASMGNHGSKESYHMGLFRVVGIQ